MTSDLAKYPTTGWWLDG